MTNKCPECETDLRPVNWCPTCNEYKDPVEHKELVLMVGMQASGKSSFFKKELVDTHVRINLDMLRTRNKEMGLFKSALKYGISICVDDTNPSKEVRARFIKEAKKQGFDVICYLMESNLESCLIRNNLRKGKAKIPKAGLLNFNEKFEEPEYDEGFDMIYRVKLNPAEMDFITEIVIQDE